MNYLDLGLTVIVTDGYFDTIHIPEPFTIVRSCPSTQRQYSRIHYDLLFLFDQLYDAFDEAHSPPHG